jgi:alternate signal-mediated exported protein
MLQSLRDQRIFMVMVVFSISLLLSVGTVYAYSTEMDWLTNVLKSQNLTFSFKVDEQFISPKTIKPGQKVAKVVNVVNTGDEAGFVRVLALARIIAADGSVLEAIPGTTFTFNGLNTTTWPATGAKMWAEGNDGYYYYLGRLEPGKATSQPLFEGVTLATGLPAEYKDATFKIEIKVEVSETVRAKYRDGWWGQGDVAPSSYALAWIDHTLLQWAKTP